VNYTEKRVLFHLSGRVQSAFLAMTGEPLEKLKAEIEGADTEVEKSLTMMAYICKVTLRAFFHPKRKTKCGNQ
jgi:hypothetical protein